MNKQREIRVDFPIIWNKKTGRMTQAMMMKVANYLISTKLLKNGTDYFITDSNEEVTYWSVNGKDDFYNSFYNHCITVEFTEDETENCVDRFNLLSFNVRKGKVCRDDFDYESYRP